MGKCCVRRRSLKSSPRDLLIAILDDSVSQLTINLLLLPKLHFVFQTITVRIVDSMLILCNATSPCSLTWMFFQQFKRSHEEWLGHAPNGEVLLSSCSYPLPADTPIIFEYSVSHQCLSHFLTSAFGLHLIVGFLRPRSSCSCRECNGYDTHGHHQNKTGYSGLLADDLPIYFISSTSLFITVFCII
jgi:hypothetical protein